MVCVKDDQFSVVLKDPFYFHQNGCGLRDMAEQGVHDDRIEHGVWIGQWPRRQMIPLDFPVWGQALCFLNKVATDVRTVEQRRWVEDIN